MMYHRAICLFVICLFIVFFCEKSFAATSINLSEPVILPSKAATEDDSAFSGKSLGENTGEIVTYKRFSEKRFGFSMDIPSNWSWEATIGSTDYLLSGPVGTDAAEIQVIIQVVDTRMGGTGSLQDQMLNMASLFSGMSGSKIVKKDQYPVAAEEAFFFVATYQAENGSGELVEFGHTQLGLEHSPYILLISYAAPREIYQAQVKIFQRMMDTLQLGPGEPAQ